jgi:hypothetical protein
METPPSIPCAHATRPQKWTEQLPSILLSTRAKPSLIVSGVSYQQTATYASSAVGKRLCLRPPPSCTYKIHELAQERNLGNGG